jgi:predicted ester cyclase
MNALTGEALYADWLRLWNGELDLAPRIIAAGCTIHQAPFGAGEAPTLVGPDGITQLVEMGRTPFDEITFTLAVGPIVTDTFVAARWQATGTYGGGLPGATAPPGREVSFHGNDILRLADRLVAEYWVSSDGAYLMAQLGML